MVARRVSRDGFATAEAEAWLAMALRAAHLAASGKPALGELFSLIVQVLLSACLAGYSTADRLVLSEWEAVFRSLSGHFGRKIDICAIRRELRLFGEGKLAQQICGPATPCGSAYPGQTVEALRFELSLPLSPSPSSSVRGKQHLGHRLVDAASVEQLYKTTAHILWAAMAADDSGDDGSAEEVPMDEALLMDGNTTRSL